MFGSFEFMTSLQYKVKHQQHQLELFQSGEKYVKMNSEHRAVVAKKNREIEDLKRGLAAARAETVTMRNHWFQVFEDIEKEHAKETQKQERIVNSLTERALRAERRVNELKDNNLMLRRERYAIEAELEEERGKNQKLTAQINRDYENSSLPSSAKPKRKKIASSREKSDKKPGGQLGHKGHLRQKHTPTNVINIPAPEKYTHSPDYKPTGQIITKQVVDLCIGVTVDEYSTPEFRNVHTGQRVHAEFPEGLVNEVTYGGDIKSFAFLMNNFCNVSILKVSDFLSELTNGKLKISAGMINGLSKEFSQKTEAEQKKAFADILLSPVVNVDFTSARVNGENKQIVICATPDAALYSAREHKGFEGVKGTPIETHQQTLVHDHDLTFYSYGGAHQECLEHPIRYLKAIIENEPNLKWHQQMRVLLQEMIHFWKSLDPEDKRNPDEMDPGKVDEFETRYDEVLDLAKKEYEYEPPGKYNKDGFNLHLKLLNYKVDHLLFLHDRRVPPTNNLAERLLRVIKRKLAQVMAFRSFDGLDYYAQSIGVIATLRGQGRNLFNSVASKFNAPTNGDGNTAS